MTTFVPFQPVPDQPFAFPATFDDATYQVNVRWNAFGQRWYVQVESSAGEVVCTLPVIGSPDSGDINILAGYFVVSTLVFRVSSQTFEVGP